MLLLLPSKKAVVIVDPFQIDRGTDVSTNFLRWYQDEVSKRFPGNNVFSGLDTSTWRVIVAQRNNPNNIIFTPIQTDGYSCGVLSAMMAYYFLMYGELPSTQFFTCEPVHVTQMRLFMLFEIARLSTLPPRWTARETELYNGTQDQIAANRSVRKQRALAQRQFQAQQDPGNLLNSALREIDAEFAEKYAQALKDSKENPIPLSGDEEDNEE